MNLAVGGLNDTVIQHVQPVKILFMTIDMNLDLLLHLLAPNIFNDQHYFLSWVIILLHLLIHLLLHLLTPQIG